MPVDAAARYTRNSMTATLLHLSGGLTPLSTEADATPTPCRYLVVERAATSEALQLYVAKLHGNLLAADGRRDLYRLP
jgi:hypothetical protein